jgi:hypothetical protein
MPVPQSFVSRVVGRPTGKGLSTRNEVKTSARFMPDADGKAMIGAHTGKPRQSTAGDFAYVLP